eukprot:6171834-Pleurochrysis_carterae.AAC.1
MHHAFHSSDCTSAPREIRGARSKNNDCYLMHLCQLLSCSWPPQFGTRKVEIWTSAVLVKPCAKRLGCRPPVLLLAPKAKPVLAMRCNMHGCDLQSTCVHYHTAPSSERSMFQCMIR